MVGKRRTNRKREAGFLFPIPLAIVLSLAAVLSLGYLWLCGRCEAMGGDIRRLERRQEALRRQVVNEEFKWSNLTSLRSIERALAQFDLPLRWPTDRQVIHLSRPLRAVELTAAPGAPTQVARRGSLPVEGHD